MSAAALSRYRWLLYEFTRREIANRYAGSLSGVAWTFLQPLAQLAIYAVIFTQVFRASVPPEFPGVTYTAFVAVALWPWIMFAEAVQRGMVSITANAGLIRKVALPNQVFVFSSVIACYAIHLAGFLVVLGVLAAMGENIRLAAVPSALLLLAPYLLIATGAALILAALQTLLRTSSTAPASFCRSSSTRRPSSTPCRSRRRRGAASCAGIRWGGSRSACARC
jgi:ABC-type polysaccharide/polyol phosphate export systems, permease component